MVGSQHEQSTMIPERRAGRLLGMNTLTNTKSVKTLVSKPVAVASSATIAVAAAVSGIIAITHEQSSESTIVGIEHVSISCLTLTLLLMVPVLIHLAQISGRPLGARLAAVGCVVLAVLSTSSNIMGEDASFFAVVAAPSNLLIMAGLIITAVALRRHTTAPLALAVGLPLMWIAALPLALLGGGLLVSAYWIALAWNLNHDRINPARRA